MGKPAIEAFPFIDNAVYRSSACGYTEYAEFSLLRDVFNHRVTLDEQCDTLKNVGAEMLADRELFDGNAWSRWTSNNWHYPIIACILYGVMLLGLKVTANQRQKMRLDNVVWVWNFGLSIFSLAGAAYCVPRLLFGTEAGLLTAGFYPAVCAPALSYGFGMSGFFTALFIYSKFFELLDTTWLLLRKHDVIVLHWYHHFTVLLYCWHSYSVRIGTGLWFAAMNYSVHTVMYFYYGLSEFKPTGRNIARKFARFVTLVQLSQMVVGITVTVASIYFHAQGEVCYVSLVNSALGLIMYSSYFLLFLQLYVEKYHTKKAKPQSSKGA